MYAARVLSRASFAAGTKRLGAFCDGGEVWRGLLPVTDVPAKPHSACLPHSHAAVPRLDQQQRPLPHPFVSASWRAVVFKSAFSVRFDRVARDLRPCSRRERARFASRNLVASFVKQAANQQCACDSTLETQAPLPFGQSEPRVLP